MMYQVFLVIGLDLLLLAGIVAWRGEHFIYYPDPYPGGSWDFEGKEHLVEEVEFESTDGTHLNGWFAGLPDTDKTLLWFHGNAGNITHHRGDLKFFTALGLQVFLIDYRGYGKSEGKPSEEGLYRDGRAAWQYARNQLNVPADNLYIMGHSMGGAIATELATDVDAGGLLLLSPFTSIQDMVFSAMPLPVLNFLFRTEMNNVKKIGHIDMPLLLFHGEEDRVVPPWMGRKLYETAPEPRTFIEVPGAGHHDLIRKGTHLFQEHIPAFTGSSPALNTGPSPGTDQGPQHS